MTIQSVRAAADKFHAHLDVCKQCADKPFELCAEGRSLIQAVGKVYEELRGGRI
jgi:hypothetical protein